MLIEYAASVARRPAEVLRNPAPQEVDRRRFPEVL
jgi:hypothetical protein